MHWKLKAQIQKRVSALPLSLSYALYYWMQRHFGGLTTADRSGDIKAGIGTCRIIDGLGYRLADKVFLEVGTGRSPVVPIVYWLAGAKKVITIDVNRYLEEEIIRRSVDHLSDKKDRIASDLGPMLVQTRLDQLLRLSGTDYAVSDLLDLCNITYIAPGHARHTGLPSKSIDFHTSYNVFEHVRPDALRGIIEEGNRIISSTGLFVHRIDYSDHFSHSDRTISPINFLQYSEAKWDRYAGNRYMYMNRLRHDDFLLFLEGMGHRVVLERTDEDQACLDIVRSGRLPLHETFKDKTERILSITGSWLASVRTNERDRNRGTPLPPYPIARR